MAQILQLGLSGLETTLEDDSRSFTSSGNNLNSIEGRSADGSLHVDFVSNKKTFNINYTVVSEANKGILTGIYELQIDNAAKLSFIYTDQSGANVTTMVKMSAPSFGAIIPNSVYYYSGASIELEEY